MDNNKLAEKCAKIFCSAYQDKYRILSFKNGAFRIGVHIVHVHP